MEVDIIEVLSELYGYMDEALGMAQVIEGTGKEIEGFPELMEMVEATYDKTKEVLNNYTEE